jgi:hypothetical protein
MKEYLVVTAPLGVVGRPEGADLYLVEREAGRADVVLLSRTIPSRYGIRGGWKTRLLRNAKQELLAYAEVLAGRSKKTKAELILRIKVERDVQLQVLALAAPKSKSPTSGSFRAGFGNVCAGERRGSFSNPFGDDGWY